LITRKQPVDRQEPWNEQHSAGRRERSRNIERWAAGRGATEPIVGWDAIATFALAFVTLIGFNLGAIRWVLSAQARELHGRLETIKHEGTDFSHGVERELLKLKAELPVEYVRREDWIRFSNTLEAKLDALRAELRAEILALRERLYDRNQPVEQETTL
jgi:hypothetical protein